MRKSLIIGRNPGKLRPIPLPLSASCRHTGGRIKLSTYARDTFGRFFPCRIYFFLNFTLFIAANFKNLPCPQTPQKTSLSGKTCSSKLYIKKRMNEHFNPKSNPHKENGEYQKMIIIFKLKSTKSQKQNRENQAIYNGKVGICDKEILNRCFGIVSGGDTI